MIWLLIPENHSSRQDRPNGRLYQVVPDSPVAAEFPLVAATLKGHHRQAFVA
jgi:hypothetical protein